MNKNFDFSFHLLVARGLTQTFNLKRFDTFSLFDTFDIPFLF